MKGTLSALSLIERSDLMIISGVKGAFMKASMTVRNDDGRTFECLSEVYIIQSQRALFTCSFTGPLSPELRPVEDFMHILSTIRVA